MALSFRKKYISPKKLQVLVAIFMFASVGAYIVIQSKAFTLNYHAESFISYAQGIGHDDGNYNAGETLEASVTASSDNYSNIPGGPTTGQLRMIFFSDPGKVDYLGYTCDPNITCYESGWDNPTGTFNGRKDLKLCVSMPLSHAVSGQQLPHILTIHYKVREPADSSFNLTVADGSGSGTCEANPYASGVAYNGGGSACFNNRFGGGGCQGSEIGFANYNPNGFNGGFGIKGTGQDIATDTKPNPNNNQHQTASAGGGGGSSATTQSDQSNNIPTSSAQGQTAQTIIEPSPFYDGKQYEPGSDPDILGVNTSFSVAGHKLRYGWLYLIVVLTSGFTAYYIYRKKPQFLKTLKRRIRW